MKTTLARWFDSDIGHSFRTSPMAMLAAAIALPEAAVAVAPPAPDVQAMARLLGAGPVLAVLVPWLGRERVSVQVTATLEEGETRQTVERVRNVMVGGQARPLEKTVRTTFEPEGRAWPFEVWANGPAEPRGLGAVAKTLSMDMRANDHGWLEMKLEALAKTPGDSFEMPMPPHGERAPSAEERRKASYKTIPALMARFKLRIWGFCMGMV